MSKFALKTLEEIHGKQNFEKLVVNDKCLFEEFEQEIQKSGRYSNELAMLFSYMEFIANGKTLPYTKFKDITPKKEQEKEYEFKTKHLRVYAIKKKNGKIIIMGGYKNSQKKDISKFRSIKEEYIKSLNY